MKLELLTALGPVCAGLDYVMGNAALVLFTREITEENLAGITPTLEYCVRLRAAHKQPFVNKACQELRPLIADGPEFRVHALNIIESFSAPIAARKLLELIREERFKLRQIALPYYKETNGN